MSNSAEAAQIGSSGRPAVKRSFDHFVISAQDLDTAAALYKRLGFRVLPIMEHVEIGTANVIIQFSDTYLEIIGDFDHCRVPELNDHMSAWHALGDVFWQVSLTSDGLEEERSGLEASGLQVEPIRSARRRVRLPQSGWIDTDSRSMYIWNPNNILTSIFMSDHRKPEAIWVPGYMSHPNTAERISRLRYMAREPLEGVDYYTTLFGAEPVEATSDIVRFETPRGEVFEILSEARCRHIMPGVGALEDGIKGRGAGMTILVESLERCRWTLRDGGIPIMVSDGSLFVGPAHACGVVLEFRES